MLQAGRILFTHGDSCSVLYIVIHGSVRLYLSAANGRELTVTLAGRGSALGVIPMCDFGAAKHHAVAHETCLVLCIPHDVIHRTVDPARLQRCLLEYSVRQIRHMWMSLEDLSLYSMEVRVARLLYRLHQQAPGNPALRTHRLDQTTIATMVNGTRPRVNAQLQKLRHLGAISIDGGRIVVRQADLLAQVAKLA